MANLSTTLQEHQAASQRWKAITGSWLKENRTGFCTQVELAEVLGVSYQQIHKYESGINTLPDFLFLKVCRFLGLEPHMEKQNLFDKFEKSVGIEAEPFGMSSAHWAIIRFANQLKISVPEGELAATIRFLAKTAKALGELKSSTPDNIKKRN